MSAPSMDETGAGIVERGAMEERAAVMVMQAIPGEVTVPDARRILDAVRAFAREQDAIRAELVAALDALMEAVHVHQVPADNKAWPLWDECTAALEKAR